MKRTPVIRILLALVVIALLTWGLWPSPVQVDATQAAVKPLAVTVNEEGKTRVIDRYIVSSPLAGYLRRLNLDVGDSVEKQQEIAQLEPLKSTILDPRARAEAQARVKGAESAFKVAQQNLDATQADLDYAKSEFERKQKLKANNTISQDELDLSQSALRRIEANHRSATFSVEVARYELDAAKTTLEQYNTSAEPQELVAVNAPITGRVLKVYRESEGVINPSDPIVELGNPNALEIEVDVLSMDAVRIQGGTKVTFAHWGGDETLEGVVRLVEPVGFTKISALGVEEQRVLVIADLTTPAQAWNRLGDGYRVEANFIIWQQNEVLQVPASSLFRLENQWHVFTIKNHRLAYKKVEVGETNGLQTQILSGLQAGDWVVQYPDQDLQSGQKVVTK